MVKLFQRVATGEIQMDASEAQQMSPAGQDLLRGMLLPDPRRRLVVTAVVAHPWFQHSLPQGAALMNDLLMAEAGAAPVQSPQVGRQAGRGGGGVGSAARFVCLLAVAETHGLDRLGLRPDILLL
jgi:hypothetical protein